jgi:hypothetical protein
LYKASGGQKSGEERNGIFLRPILVLRCDAARMALGDASWYAAPIDPRSSSTGGEYPASSWPQPMVDNSRVCAADKSDRLMGVRVHPMAGPRLGYCQVMVRASMALLPARWRRRPLLAPRAQRDFDLSQLLRSDFSLSRQALHKGYLGAATPAAVQQTGRRKRLIGAPRAIWAALWIQSSWGGKPHRSQRSQSPQVKLDLRGRDRRAILLGNTRRMTSSVRITHLHGFVCRIFDGYHQRH